MAAAADTSVCVFSSTQTGAPSLSNLAGNLIAVLDACLVNGWGLVTCDSVVIAGGVGTATINAGHAAIPYGVVLFAGATGTLSAVNGRRKVKSATASTLTFDAADLADGTVTGTITMKIAPAGWTKAFSGTNLAAYKSSVLQASSSYLYVDDTTTTYATVRGYESMTSITGGAGMFPTAALASVSVWKKSDSTSNRYWWVVADGSTFYIGIAPSSSATYATSSIIWMFGDIKSLRAADAYRSILMSSSQTTIPAPANTDQPIPLTSTGTGIRHMPRSWTGLGTAVAVTPTWFDSNVASSGSGYQATGRPFPNGPDNSIVVTPHWVLEASGVYRGKLRGIFMTPQVIGSSLADRDTLPAIELPEGIRDVMYLRWAHTSVNGGVFFDVTGPWAS